MSNAATTFEAADEACRIAQAAADAAWDAWQSERTPANWAVYQAAKAADRAAFEARSEARRHRRATQA